MHGFVHIQGEPTMRPWEAIKGLLGMRQPEPVDERASWTKADWDAAGEQAGARAAADERRQRGTEESGRGMMGDEGIARHEEQALAEALRDLKAGEINPPDMVELYQHLADAGQLDRLKGLGDWYHETAHAWLREGVISAPERKMSLDEIAAAGRAGAPQRGQEKDLER